MVFLKHGTDMNKIAWATGAGRTFSRLGKKSSAAMNLAQTKLTQREQFWVSHFLHIGTPKLASSFGEYLQQNPKNRHGQCLFLFDFQNKSLSAEIAIENRRISRSRDWAL